MKKLSAFLICLFCVNLFSQSSASIYIDDLELDFKSNLSIPYWISEGKNIDLGPNVKSLSIIEFNVDNNDLVFNQVIHLTSSSEVPTSKVWKIVALGLGINSNGASYSFSGFSNDSKPSIFTSPIEFTSNGSWLVPQGVQNVCIEVWGRGGRGGDVSFNNNTYYTNLWAGAGGGGAYGYECFNVTAGTQLNITIDNTASSVNNLISAGAGQPGTNLFARSDNNHDLGTNGLGGTSTAAYNIPGDDGGTNGPGIGGKAGNGGAGGDRGDSNRAASPGESPGGGGGAQRLYQNGNISDSGREGGDGKVIIYF